MANPTNFVRLTGPQGQKLFYAVPKVLTFNNEDPIALQNDINTVFDGMALPLNPDQKYTVLTIDYSSAQLANNTISYSALVYYQSWTPV